MKAPSAPDPQQTANAQAGMNKDAAITQFLLNATNQVTPTGSLTYSQTGQNFAPSDTGQTYWYNPSTGQYTQSAPGGTGGGGGTRQVVRERVWDDKRAQYINKDVVKYVGGGGGGSPGEGWTQVKGNLVPQYTATQTLTPDQQAILDNQEEMMKRLTALGITQSDRLNTLLSTPFSLDNEATESRLMELGRKRLDPALDRRRASTEQDLYNRGVRTGSQAYNTAQSTLNEGENDAYNQLLLTGRGQAVQEALTARNQPINEILSLAGLNQVSQPNFVNTPGSQVSPPDYQGAVNQKYQQELASYQSGMSGLFGLGSAALGGWATAGFPKPSDERLKTDKKKVGETDDGIDIYSYRYKGSPMMEMGVMAQDVKKKKPGAVSRMPSGYLAVDYSRV